MCLNEEDAADMRDAMQATPHPAGHQAIAKTVKLAKVKAVPPVAATTKATSTPSRMMTVHIYTTGSPRGLPTCSWSTGGVYISLPWGGEYIHHQCSGCSWVDPWEQWWCTYAQPSQEGCRWCEAGSGRQHTHQEGCSRCEAGSGRQHTHQKVVRWCEAGSGRRVVRCCEVGDTRKDAQAEHLFAGLPQGHAGSDVGW
jgi:hypothetical protein